MSKFEKGISGNPAGRPAGSLNKRTHLSKLLESRAEDLINKAIELALNGDAVSLRLCVERLMPKATDVISFPLPDLKNKTVAEVVRDVFDALSYQQVTAEELKSVLDLVNTYRDSQNDIEKDAILESLRDFEKKMLEKHKSDV